ncbi:MAG: carbon monoxide dehydrogenase [Nitriliruptorales bacterium]|nr:carbon monoxide dehydrogenase [Nitriliruptorales bacterium]
MEFEQHFTIPVPAEQAWNVLLDIERIAPCMPGTTLEEAEGDEFRGKVKVKVGPMTVTYSGTAKFVERDTQARRAVIEASGKEMRGAGTARAKITGTIDDRGGEAEVGVRTELAITGRPAQFGRGVMADVADKLLAQFADCVAGELGADQAPAADDRAGPPEGAHAGAEPAGPRPAAAAARPQSGPSDEAINLLDVAGAPLLRRVGPVLVALAGAAVVWWLRHRHRR